MKKHEITLIEVQNILNKMYTSMNDQMLIDKKIFRAKNSESLDLLARLESGWILHTLYIDSVEYYELKIWALFLLKKINEEVNSFFDNSESIFNFLKDYYINHQDANIFLSDIERELGKDLTLIKIFIKYFDFLFGSRPSNILKNENYNIQICERVIQYTSYSDLLKEIEKDTLNNVERLNQDNSFSFQSIEPSTKNINKKEVFIVHGHDELLKNEVSQFLKKLDLTPIILHEQVNKGKTVIEKLEHFTDVGHAIVLYTPCDLGGKCESTLSSRARQNVVFEHGYLIGKIGRENVSIIKKGEVELPNDITGTVYVHSNSSWQFDLAKELKSAQFEIDLNKLF